MIAVIYDPKDGRIISTMQGSEETIAMNGPYVEVDEYRIDYDANFRVENGQVVAKN